VKIPKGKRELIILSILIGAIILAGYFYLYLRPRIRALGQLLPQVARLKQDVELARSDIANIDNFKVEIASLRNELGRYEASLPGKKEIAPILDHLSKIASQAGVKIVGIKELKEARGKVPELNGARQLYSEVSIGIDLKSGYHQLGRFMNKVESSARLMKPRDIEIKADPRTPGEHNVKLIISAFVLEREKP